MENKAVDFFFEHAGWSYGPDETSEQGRMRCAVALADAERKASEAGCCFRWELDGGTNREWTDEGEETPTWCCIMHNEEGEAVQSLYGVDFGDKAPWSDPYRRVVEAELALEWATIVEMAEKRS